MEIRCELDPGFQKGREFGYGLLGGQSVDDLRSKKISERPRGEGHVPLRNLAECVCVRARAAALRLVTRPPQVHPRQAAIGHARTRSRGTHC